MDVRCFTAVLLFAPPLLGQSTWTASSFFPNEYRSELRLDLARLRAIEVMEGIESSMLAPMLAGFDQAYGFPLRDVTEIRAAIDLPDGTQKPSAAIFVISGGETVTMPSLRERADQVDELEIGDLMVKRLRPEWEGGSTTLYAAPRPGLLVQGDEHLLRPTLAGERKGGVPAPELLRHTTGGDNLAYFATYVNEAMRADMPPGTADWVLADDPLTFVMVRLHSNGDEDDPQITIEALLQCERGTTGPEHLQKQIEAGLETLQKHRQLGALKQHWKKVVVRRDDRDVRVSLALGRPRQAAGTLVQLCAPLLLAQQVDEAVAPVPVAPAAPPPEKPKKDGD